jgi:hypothetical protein
MATTGQVVPFTDGKMSPQTEIESYIDTREKARAALDALIQEIPQAAAKFKADFAKQAVVQHAGKPKLDAESLAGQFKAAKAKLDQLVEKQLALETLLDGVKDRLEELKLSAPAEYILVLDKRIAEQQKVATTTQTDALAAQTVLDDLNAERAAILAASPGAAWITTPATPVMITPVIVTTSPAPSAASASAPAGASTAARRGNRKRNGKRGRK